jgi:transcriptional regulator with XRE-family HTH domain
MAEVKDKKAVKKYRGKVGPEETREVLSLHLKGATQEQIAKAIGRSPKTILNILNIYRPFFKELANVEEYRTVRRDLLTAAELKAVRSVLDDDKHERANLRDAAYTLTQVNNARRLEEELSTSNTATKVQWQSVDLSAYKPNEDNANKGKNE